MISSGLRFGRYEVGDRIGTGGFGIVYRARDVELGREVAIKFLKPEYLDKEQVVQRFLKEARAAAQIGHPGIVTVFECGLVSGTGTADGNAFIAMELLRGESLADRMKRTAKVPLVLAISIGRQLAEALAAAHKAGIIHRDLKPDNVHLIRDPVVRGGERIKILDFGVAKLAEPIDPTVHTHSQVMLGTPRYMSPEQARSAGRVDHRSDIYSLGCILFEVLAGRPPYVGDMHDTLQAHQSAPVPPAGTSIRDLDQLVAAMMAKAPEERPATMETVSDTLGACESTSRDALVDLHGVEPTTLDQPTLVHDRSGRRRRLIRVGVLFAGGLAAGGLVAFVAGGGGGSRAEPGDAALVAQLATPDAAVVPPPPVPLPLPLPEPPPDAAATASEAKKECLELQTSEKWQDLLDCAHRYEAQGGPEAAEMMKRATIEILAAPRIHDLEAALSSSDLKAARAALAQIQKSYYYPRLANRVDQLESSVIDDAARRAKVAARRSCREYNTVLKQELEAHGARVVDIVRHRIPCHELEAPPAAPAGCDHAALTAKGVDAFGTGAYDYALTMFEAAYTCSPSTNVALRAFMAACRLGNVARAKVYYRRAKGEAAQAITICIQKGIAQAELEAP